MYSKAAEDEDDKRVDRMKKVSKGIIIFVSLRRVCNLHRSFFVK
jgi:hypothetical protein